MKILILYFLGVCFAALGGFWYRDYTAQPIVRYIEIPVERIVTKVFVWDRETIVEKPVDRIVEKIVYQPYIKSSDSKTISVEEALAIIDEGRSNHLAWATRPDLIAIRDNKTGDTDFNLMWVKLYQDIGDLLKELANGTKN